MRQDDALNYCSSAKTKPFQVLAFSATLLDGNMSAGQVGTVHQDSLCQKPAGSKETATALRPVMPVPYSLPQTL